MSNYTPFTNYKTIAVNRGGETNVIIYTATKTSMVAFRNSSFDLVVGNYLHTKDFPGGPQVNLEDIWSSTVEFNTPYNESNKSFKMLLAGESVRHTHTGGGTIVGTLYVLEFE